MKYSNVPKELLETRINLAEENIRNILSDWETSARSIVKILCSWRVLNSAITFLYEAINNKNNAFVTWNLIGRYLGRLLYILGNPMLENKTVDDSHSLKNLVEDKSVKEA